MNYHQAAALFATARYPHKGKPAGQNNTRIFQRGESYAVRFHNTDIITYHKDGSITLVPWNSNTTIQRFHDYGIPCFSNTRVPFTCKLRLGHWSSNNNKGYPFDDTVLVDPDGYVSGLVDYKRRIRPDRRGPRMKLLREFRAKALAPMVLGAWGELAKFEPREQKLGFGRWASGWFGLVPRSPRLAAVAIMKGEDPSAYMAHVRPGPIGATRIEAIRKVCDTLGRSLLDDWNDSERVKVEYPRVRVL